MSAESQSNAVLLVTSDQNLVASVRELATSAGLDLNVRDQVPAVDTQEDNEGGLVVVDSRAWSRAEQGAAIGRSGVMLAVEAGDGAWEKAAHCGFEEVIAWPQGSSWLAHRLSVVAESSVERAPVIAVVGGRGGCGATTLAVSLAVAAADSGVSSVLIDADAHGPGLARSLGIADGEGLRWADFMDITEPLAADGIRSQLAVADGFSVLTGPWGQRPPAPEARRYALEACGQAFDLVVVDVPRYELAGAGLGEAAFWVHLTTLEVGSLRTTAAWLSEHDVKSSVSVVVRSDVGPVPQQAAQEALGSSQVRRLRGSRGIRGAADFGDLGAAVGRGPIANVAQDFVFAALSGQLGD